MRGTYKSPSQKPQSEPTTFCLFSPKRICPVSFIMNTMTFHSYRDLIVWQKSIHLAAKIDDLIQKFPSQYRYGLVDQMHRSSVSIPSNIAEGRRRGPKKDFLKYLRISYASGAELETQIEISKNLDRTKNLDYEEIDDLLNQVMRMLNKMITTLNPRDPKKRRS